MCFLSFKRARHLRLWTDLTGPTKKRSWENGSFASHFVGSVEPCGCEKNSDLTKYHEINATSNGSSLICHSKLPEELQLHRWQPFTHWDEPGMLKYDVGAPAWRHGWIWMGPHLHCDEVNQLTDVDLVTSWVSISQLVNFKWYQYWFKSQLVWSYPSDGF